MNSLRSLSHRARTKRVLPGIALASVLILAGCPNPTSPPPPSPDEAVLRDARAKVAQNPSAFYVADDTALKSNILLIAHGGPVFELFEFNKINVNGNANYTRVLVQQEQMIRHANNALPTDRTITAEESREINLYSAAIIYALGEHFQRQGRTVSLYTRSWGSFVAAEMYRRWNDKPFKNVFIAVGRLDMPQEIVDNRRAITEPQKTFGSDGVSIETGLSIEQQERAMASEPGLCTSTDPQVQFFARFYCTNGTLDQAKIQKQIFLMQSMFFLAHDLLQHRYTQLLDSKALGKAIFYFGGKDRNTGRPNAKEIQFLTGRTGTISAASGFTKKTVPVVATRDVGGTPTRVTDNREVYTMIGQNGHATVKYGERDAHSMKSLLPDLQADILRSFPAPAR